MSLIQALFTSGLYKEHYIILSVCKKQNKKETKKKKASDRLMLVADRLTMLY